ncbi:MAG: response regulator transcription factor [Actinomycetota bacterium]
MIRVLIADDQELVRFGFAALINAEDDLTVVGEAADGAEAIDLAHELQPDIVLMDIRMPNVDGIEATGRLLGNPRLAHTRVLVLTTFDIDDLVYRALEVGAAGFLLKDTRPDRLLDGIRAVHSGEALLAPAITRRLIDRFVTMRNPAQRQQRLDPLTSREIEVLTHVGLGLSNDEIAGVLHISPLTAKTHVSRLIAKLAVRDRAQLVVVAYQTGLVTS